MKLITYYLTKRQRLLPILGLLLLCLSCESYLDVEDPVAQIPSSSVFEDENTATAAITTLYAKLRDEVLITGTLTGMGTLMGLYADELQHYGSPGESLDIFYNHQVIASDPTVASLWNLSYQLIYMCNAAVEGLDASQALSNEVKAQLKGEALFIRALVHFYLVNLYGDVPYITTTDYEMNSEVQRMAKETVYENIVTDVLESKDLLDATYPSPEKVRANYWVASAFLARVYLYMEQWEKAAQESSLVLTNTADFILETDLEQVFLLESTSTIFQLKPKNPGENTLEASNYIFTSGPPPLLALHPDIVADMENDDLRKQFWISEITDGTDTWYAPFKYKQNFNTGNSMEYSVVLRLAEQYLIRAEARLRIGDITGAKSDLNVIRQRAGLNDITTSNPEELLQAIITERRFELFTEFGHRWFDLRRLGLADEILSPVKPSWMPTDILLPIPETEILTNPNIQPQNPGY